MSEQQAMIELAQQLNIHAEMLATIKSYEIANAEREQQGDAPAYGEKAFSDLTNRLGCHHDARVDLMHRCCF